MECYVSENLEARRAAPSGESKVAALPHTSMVAALRLHRPVRSSLLAMDVKATRCVARARTRVTSRSLLPRSFVAIQGSAMTCIEKCDNGSAIGDGSHVNWRSRCEGRCLLFRGPLAVPGARHRLVVVAGVRLVSATAPSGMVGVRMSQDRKTDASCLSRVCDRFDSVTPIITVVVDRSAGLLEVTHRSLGASAIDKAHLAIGVMANQVRGAPNFKRPFSGRRRSATGLRCTFWALRSLGRSIVSRDPVIAFQSE